MSSTVNQDRSIQLQHFLELLGSDRKPFIETGRKFDKVFMNGKVKYFVARMDQGAVKAGDIYGAKSALAPNFRWFFGTLSSIDLWDWTGEHGKPVNDPSVKIAKSYRNYVHYERISG